MCNHRFLSVIGQVVAAMTFALIVIVSSYSHRTGSNALELFCRIFCDGFFFHGFRLKDCERIWVFLLVYRYIVYIVSNVWWQRTQRNRTIQNDLMKPKQERNTDLCLCHRWSWKRNIVFKWPFSEVCNFARVYATLNVVRRSLCDVYMRVESEFSVFFIHSHSLPFSLTVLLYIYKYKYGKEHIRPLVGFKMCTYTMIHVLDGGKQTILGKRKPLPNQPAIYRQKRTSFVALLGITSFELYSVGENM